MFIIDYRNKKSTIMVLTLIFTAALLIRFQYIRLTEDNIHVAKDAKQYVDYGKNLVHFHTFSKQRGSKPPTPDSYRSPGYPLLIALTMRIGGEVNSLKLLVYTQAVLSALLVILTFCTGICFLTTPAALLAALLVAISPHLITTAACILTETLFSFLLLSAICLFQLTLRKLSIWLAGTSAVFFGCAFLTNETVLFLPLFFIFLIKWVGYFQITQLPGKRKTNVIIIFLCIYLVFPIGWWLRGLCNVPNHASKGSDRAVVTMSHGAYPGFIYKNPRYKRFPYREDPEQPAFSSSFNNFSKILWSRVKDEPLRYLNWYLIGKPYYLWNWDIIQGVGDIYINPVKSSLFAESMLASNVKKLMQFFHPVLLVLALLGIPMICTIERSQWKISCSYRHVSLVLPMFVCIYFTIIYTIFAPWPRYSIPLRPELYLCAVWTFSLIGIHIQKEIRNTCE